MSERDTSSLSIERVRLGLLPSDQLAGALSRFYSDTTKHEAWSTSLKTQNWFSISRTESGLVRPHPYYLEEHGLPTLESRTRAYDQEALKRIAGHTIRLSTLLRVGETKHKAIRLFLDIMPTDEERTAMGSLPELNLDRFGGTIKLYTEISLLHRVPTAAGFREACFNLLTIIGDGQKSSSVDPLQASMNENENIFVTNPTLVYQPDNLRVIDESANENSQTA